MFALLVAAAAPTDKMIDVLDKVHGFYNDAWGQLIGVLALAVVVLGVLVPIFIVVVQHLGERRRNADFSRRVAEAEGKMQQELSDAKEEMGTQIAGAEGRMAAIEEQINRANQRRESGLAETMQRIADTRDETLAQIEEQEKATQKRVGYLQGHIYYNFGVVCKRTKNYAGALVCFCGAARWYLDSEKASNATQSLGGAAEIVKRKSVRQSLQASEYAVQGVREILKEIENRTLLPEWEEPVLVLQKFLAQAPESQETGTDEESGDGEGT